MNDKEALEFIRREVAHEFTLLNSRLTWLTASQSFLIAAFTLALGNVAIYDSGWYAQVVLPFLGALICCAAIPGVSGAHKTIKIWLVKQHTLMERLKNDPTFDSVRNARLEANPELDFVHSRSTTFALVLPVLLLAFWVLCALIIHFCPVQH
ncbi:MAG: hypothetical protein QM808_09265 [Steroidobacteraceae bacterium]